MNLNKEKLHSRLDKLIDQYKDNNEILEKIENFIVNQLPISLKNLNLTLIERDNRKKFLEEKSNDFISKYMNNCNFFYVPNTELFFEYKDNNYLIIREDKIIYDILNSITTNKILIPWKFKIKINIMKKIKENDILLSIPNSETIQHVIEIISEVLRFNKEETKYLLTIIGDIILKKPMQNYFINVNIKKFLKIISDNCCSIFGVLNLSNYFKFKYHDHKYSECLLIPFYGIMNEENLNSYLQISIINLLIVSCYYSNRYENSQNFLNNYNKNIKLKQYALYVKNNDEEKMIDDFIKNTIIIDSKDENSNWKEQLKWKDIMYLWNYFNELNNYPKLMYLNIFKEIFTKKLRNFYDDKSDVFINLNSHYLPEVKTFSKFWEENFVISDDDENEYEIDEVYVLFQNYKKTPSISEINLLDLIKYYYPDVIIEKDKYLINVYTQLWDKKKDIKEFLKNNNFPNEEAIYENYLKENNNKKKVSKSYFQKIIDEQQEQLKIL